MPEHVPQPPEKQAQPWLGPAQPGPVPLEQGRESAAPVTAPPALTTPLGGTPNASEAAPVLAHWAEQGGNTQVPDSLHGLLRPVFLNGDPEQVDIAALVAVNEMSLQALRQAKAAAATGGSMQLQAQVDSVITSQAPAISRVGTQVRDATLKLANDSSLLKQDGVKEPTFPTREDARRLAAQGAELLRMGGDSAFPASPQSKASLQQAGGVLQDAALTILQSLSVVAARDTWKQGQRTEDPKNPNQKGRPRNALDDVFKDSGFGDEITTDERGRIFDWCGMFVDSSMFRGGGLAKELRGGFWHVDNVKDFFQYQQAHNAGRVPLSIWAEGRWWGLHEYHAARGTPRTWMPRAQVAAALAGGGAADIRPGDTCLIDHGGHDNPSHIVMVESYDASTGQLVTIEGNTSGIRANKDGEVNRMEDGEHINAGTGNSGTGLHIRDMNSVSPALAKEHPKDPKAPKPPEGAYKGKSGATVWAIGRPSLVDYEDGHSYAVNSVPELLRATSPEAMRELAKKRGADKTEQKEQQAIRGIGLK